MLPTNRFFIVHSFSQPQIVRSALQEDAQLPRSRRVTQLPQRLGLNLADALAGDRKGIPTSSRVCSEPSSMPKRILMMRSSRGVSVFNKDAVCSFKLSRMAASEGEATALSSMK